MQQAQNTGNPWVSTEVVENSDRTDPDCLTYTVENEVASALTQMHHCQSSDCRLVSILLSGECEMCLATRTASSGITSLLHLLGFISDVFCTTSYITVPISLLLN